MCLLHHRQCHMPLLMMLLRLLRRQPGLPSLLLMMRAAGAYSKALGSYRDSLAAFTQWCDEDARAAAVLSQSVQPQFASEFMGLATVAEMWSHLHQCYHPSGDSLYLSVLRQEHDLQHGDSTVDEFYTQSAAIWRQLDSLRSDRLLLWEELALLAVEVALVLLDSALTIGGLVTLSPTAITSSEECLLVLHLQRPSPPASLSRI
ncbi:hypothetical protein QYE76_046745 [Lolium multiflorum]|uniref:Uncharacterized protein n=1 Tax=Lolium multiflorum TaxID=4521 RepID=A0AAD8TQE7_LOLMU|nr:hypothetical protein QYE76_046745 [Lolium multiflorum]